MIGGHVDMLSGHVGKLGGHVDKDVVTVKLDIQKLNELMVFCQQARTREEMQTFCGIGSRDYFHNNVLKPLLISGRLRRTIPDKPKSKKQKYIKV